SFPMALHVGKLLVDAARALPPRFSRWPAIVVCLPVLVTNVVQAAEATRPGRQARNAVLTVLQDIRSACPPRLLVEAWQAFFFEQVYLRDSCAQASVVPIYDTFSAGQYEHWLKDHEGELPE